MKKRLLFSAALIAAMLSAPSCSKEKGSDPGIDGKRREIVIRPVNVVSTRSAISSTDFPALYDMAVSMYRNAEKTQIEDESGNFYEGIQFSKNESTLSWKSVSGPKYWPQNGTLDFLAIAGAGLKDGDSGIVPVMEWNRDNVSSGVTLTVQDNSEKFDDILYGAVNGADASSSGVDIVFHHAFAAVTFVGKCDVAYNQEENVGVTVDGITVDGAAFGGKLTVDNPASGGSTGELSALWSDLTDVNQHVAARVWNSANTGADAQEAPLSALHLGTEARSLSDAPFGEAYVLVPQQDAVPFTISYTLHSGFAADGTTPLDEHLTYQYTPYGLWQSGKKYCYCICINLKEIQIQPSVIDWNEIQAREVNPTQKASAIYNVASLFTATLPKMALGFDCALKVDWGDGSPLDVYENRLTKTTLAADGGIITPKHSYKKRFSGQVKLYVEGDCAVCVRKQDSNLTVVDENKVFVSESGIMLWSTGSSTIEMVSKGSLNKPSLEYSYDGKTWTAWDLSQIPLSGDNRIFLRGKNPSGLNAGGNIYNYNYMVLGGDAFYSEGNANTLLDYENPDAVTTAPRFAFYHLFDGNSNLHTSLDLPATTVSEYSYGSMYEGCSALEKIPAELPATTLGPSCYHYMFEGCESFRAAPKKLPATTLTAGCYEGMFMKCISMENAPELPATKIPSRAYCNLFFGCSSLAKAPNLPGTEISDCSYLCMFGYCKSIKSAPALPIETPIPEYAYGSMFEGCVLLEKAPDLPAKTIGRNAYEEMFYNCSSLTAAPEIGAETLGTQSCLCMFQNCTSLVDGPVLKAAVVPEMAYKEMFKGCTKLKSVTVLAEDISATYCVDDMLETGKLSDYERTFYYKDGVNWTMAYIPSYWNKVPIAGQE